MALAGFD